LLDYQEEGIVSRILFKGNNGTITLLAFDDGQELSEHSAPFDVLVHVLDGEAQFTVGGEPRRIGSGQVTLMPADVPHAVKALSRFKMIVTMIRG
jgi:quercetin dioxygenase-like cupin family protein